MDKEQLYERIEAYLSGKMSQTEMNSFEQEIAANPNLAAEVALHAGLHKVVQEEAEITDLKNKIGQVVETRNSKISRHPQRSRLLSQPIFRIAASIVLLSVILAAAFFYVKPFENKSDALFTQYMDYPTSIYEASSLRSDPGEVSVSEQQIRLDSLWKLADQWYQQKNYNSALSSLEQVKTLETQLFQQPSSRFYYYQGILQTRTAQFAAALQSFELVISNYTEEANWNRALILLRLGNRDEEAKQILSGISNFKTPRQEDARSLLKQLDSR